MKKNVTSARPKFNKSNLNSNFFANAKKSNADEVKGWAFDFDKEAQETKAAANHFKTPKPTMSNEAKA